ncbi:hypothetical protein [Streptomyces sp. STCH 565 A]|uniref:hypothetical protein n=1 Tax=Streptomyces sp. STCH 565 A TaxID=2950532 RepID=UPI002074D3F9|nr:hypothetical protein [Streptomyces sp. STCH 565 A]MCM8548836.1 hypothetical protein [Streptomyces sp. STCH 565 A]
MGAGKKWSKERSDVTYSVGRLLVFLTIPLFLISALYLLSEPTGADCMPYPCGTEPSADPSRPEVIYIQPPPPTKTDEGESIAGIITAVGTALSGVIGSFAMVLAVRRRPDSATPAASTSDGALPDTTGQDADPQAEPSPGVPGQP